jgi:hypothetical protein
MKKPEKPYRSYFGTSARDSGKAALNSFGEVDRDFCDFTSGKMLLLDFDGKPPKYSALSSMFKILRSVNVRPLSFCYARSNRGWHVAIILSRKIGRLERVALQAILGSDRKRECLNLFRVLAMRGKKVSPFWEQRWNLMFIRKVY